MVTRVKNLWGLDKDPSIKAILILLQHQVEPDSFMLLDEELLNEKAVRVVSPKNQKEVSAYIYSYAQKTDHYGLDLEFPYLIATRADDQSVRLNELTAEDVIEKVIDHLELNLKTRPS